MREVRLASMAGIFQFRPGDRFVSPLGRDIYIEPTIAFPGWGAFGFTLKGATVGVLLVRRGGPTQLRYCDNEGLVHEELIAGDSLEQQMMAGSVRMSTLIKEFLGERHPLAQVASANALPV